MKSITICASLLITISSLSGCSETQSAQGENAEMAQSPVRPLSLPQEAREVCFIENGQSTHLDRVLFENGSAAKQPALSLAVDLGGQYSSSVPLTEGDGASLQNRNVHRCSANQIRKLEEYILGRGNKGTHPCVATRLSSAFGEVKVETAVGDFTRKQIDVLKDSGWSVQPIQGCWTAEVPH